jgi:hypothetical protein
MKGPQDPLSIRDRPIAALLALIALAACGSNTPLPSQPPDCQATFCSPEPPVPSGPDGSADLSAPDVLGDLAADAAADRAPDVAPDVGPDLAADSGRDLVADTAALPDLAADASPGVLSLEPTYHQFVTTVLGSTESFTFRAANRGGGTLSGLSLAVNGPDFVVPAAMDHCAGVAALEPGGFCEFEVEFKPVSRGMKIGSVVASASAQIVTSSLAGTAATPPQLVISPPTATFSGVSGQSGTPVIFTVANAGDAFTGALTVALGGADAEDYAITSNLCLGALAAYTTCTVQVAFKPVSAGVKSAILSVTSLPGGAVTSQLGGLAQAPSALTITPDTADFGTTFVGGTTQPTTFQVKNNGGTATAPLTVATGTGEFTLTANTCGGASLPPAGTCSLAVVFAPATPGSKATSLSVFGSGNEVVIAHLKGESIP